MVEGTNQDPNLVLRLTDLGIDSKVNMHTLDMCKYVHTSESVRPQSFGQLGTGVLKCYIGNSAEFV